MYTLTIDNRAIAKIFNREGRAREPLVMTDEVKEEFFKKLYKHNNLSYFYDNCSELHYVIGKNTINMYYLTIPFLEITFPENEREYTKNQFENILDDLWLSDALDLITKNNEIYALQKEVAKLRAQLVHEGLVKAAMHPNKIAKLLEDDEDTDLDCKI